MFWRQETGLEGELCVREKEIRVVSKENVCLVDELVLMRHKIVL